MGFLLIEIKIVICAGRIENLASVDWNFDFYWKKSQSGSSLKYILIFTEKI